MRPDKEEVSRLFLSDYSEILFGQNIYISIPSFQEKRMIAHHHKKFFHKGRSPTFDRKVIF